jgi:hypothetical protein
MGGQSKNGPEYLFRRHLVAYGLTLQSLSVESPRIHQFMLDDRRIKTISLISPSNAANRSIGANPKFKEEKRINKNFTTLQFRIDQYRKFFI